MGGVILQHHLQRQLGMQARHGDRTSVTLGHGVWVGDSVIVLPGVTVGNGAVLGAGAIVTRDVTAYATVAGNPARELGRRFDERVAAALDKTEWWQLNPAELEELKPLLSRDLSVMPADESLELIANAARTDRSDSA